MDILHSPFQQLLEFHKAIEASLERDYPKINICACGPHFIPDGWQFEPDPDYPGLMLCKHCAYGYCSHAAPQDIDQEIYHHVTKATI